MDLFFGKTVEIHLVRILDTLMTYLCTHTQLTGLMISDYRDHINHKVLYYAVASKQKVTTACDFLAGGIPCHQWNIYIDGLCVQCRLSIT